MEHSGTPEKPRTPPRQKKKNRNTPQKNQNTSQNTKSANMLPLKKSCAHELFYLLHPLIAHKIIWFHHHNLENIYKRHTVTNFLPASRSLSSLAETNSKYKQNMDIFSFCFETWKMQDTHWYKKFSHLPAVLKGLRKWKTHFALKCVNTVKCTIKRIVINV